MVFVIEHEELIKAASPISNSIQVGVYFLLRKKQVVYVGQSSNCAARISAHTQDLTKDFDSCYTIVISDPVFRTDYEIASILKYSPKYNKTIPTPDAKSRLFLTPKLVWKRKIPNQEVKAYIYGGQVIIAPKDIIDFFETYERN